MRLNLLIAVATTWVAATSALAAPPAASGDKCFVIAETAGVVTTTRFELDLGALSAGTPLPALPKEAGAVLCNRAVFALGPNDWRVPAEYGKPFY